MGRDGCLVAVLGSMHWLTWVGLGVLGQSQETRGDAAGVVMAVASDAADISVDVEKADDAEKAEDAEPERRFRALAEARRAGAAGDSSDETRALGVSSVR